MSTFDVAVCVFGIFFVPDMEAAACELKRVLRPGGVLALQPVGPWSNFRPTNANA
jgi:ubiquinone/menaquinone biosynthesis C-methylase UbiE